MGLSCCPPGAGTGCGQALPHLPGNPALPLSSASLRARCGSHHPAGPEPAPLERAPGTPGWAETCRQPGHAAQGWRAPWLQLLSQLPGAQMSPRAGSPASHFSPLAVSSSIIQQVAARRWLGFQGTAAPRLPEPPVLPPLLSPRRRPGNLCA